MAAIRIKTLAQRKAAASELARVKVDEMTPGELSCACALLLRKPVVERDMADKNAPTLASASAKGPLAPFDPLGSPGDFLELMEQAEVVVSTHGHDHELPKSKQDIWYSAHSFISGCKAEGRDLRETVARCLAKRLFHDVEYSSAWGNQ